MVGVEIQIGYRYRVWIRVKIKVKFCQTEEPYFQTTEQSLPREAAVELQNSKF